VLSVTNSAGFVSQIDYFDRKVASKNLSNYKIIKQGYFAYNPSRINVGSIDLLQNYEVGVLSPMYIIFKTNDKLDNYFFKYWLSTNIFKQQLKIFLSGSVRQSLNFNDMQLMKIKLPPLAEQQKIAKVLSTADREIELLKEELEQLKKQKKGLMQRLLSGEVRVRV